jgi:ribosome-associated protein
MSQQSPDERFDPVGLRVSSRLVIPLSEIGLRRSRSSGPGGQHANVTESRVEAVFDVEASVTLSEDQKRRIITKIGPIVTASAQDERSQLRNRELALERLAEKLKSALAQPKPRRPTKPSRAAKERRLKTKQRQSEKKQARRPPSSD